MSVKDLLRRWVKVEKPPQIAAHVSAPPPPAPAPVAPAPAGTPVDHSHKDYKNFVRHDLFLGFLLARGFQPKVAYDVGAYSGEWARWFRRRWPDAALYLFEPLTEMNETLTGLCGEFPNTHHLNVALGEEPGQQTFNTWPVASRSSFLTEDHPDWGERTTRTVPVESIEHLVQSGRIPAPELIKLDVQGAELMVLRGAGAVLPQIQVIVIEVSLYPLYGSENPTVDAVMAALSGWGFVLFDIIGFVRRPVDHALLQADFVFVRHDHPLRTPGPLQQRHLFDW